MDRKKTIVAAVMINAGLLTVLFIAAMTMREERVDEPKIRAAAGPKEERPLFNEIVEVVAPIPVPISALALAPAAQPVLVNPPASFTLPLEEPATAPPAGEPLVTVAPPPIPFPSAVEIEVQKGDSLDKLAKLHRTSVDEIIKLNQLPSSFLRVGQRLKIPSEKTIETPKSKSTIPLADSKADYYTMKVGDNPWSIAMKHHMKVDEPLKLNGLNEKSARKLKPGDRLRIK